MMSRTKEVRNESLVLPGLSRAAGGRNRKNERKKIPSYTYTKKRNRNVDEYEFDFVIGRTCTFESKIGIIFVGMISVSYCG